MNFAGVQRSSPPEPQGLGEHEGLGDHGRLTPGDLLLVGGGVGGDDRADGHVGRGRGVGDSGPKNNHWVVSGDHRRGRVVARGWHGDRDERGHGQDERNENDPLHGSPPIKPGVAFQGCPTILLSLCVGCYVRSPIY